MESEWIQEGVRLGLGNGIGYRFGRLLDFPGFWVVSNWPFFPYASFWAHPAADAPLTTGFFDPFIIAGIPFPYGYNVPPD